MKILLCLILAYLIGSIPSAYLIGKIFFHKDIREMGSGNVGTTNTFRSFGKVAGVTVWIMDVLKGTLASFLPIFAGYTDRHLMLLTGFFAIIGHSYSIFLKFKGGKSAATSTGVLLAYRPDLFIGVYVFFFIVVYLTSTVSIATMATFIFFWVSTLFLNDPIFSVIAFIVMVIGVYRHKENIKRLKNGTENLVPFGLKYKRSQQHEKK